MRKLLYFIVFSSFLFSFSACKKCYQCSVLDEDSTTIYEYPDICGSKSDANAYEERCKTEYGSFDFTCACGEKQ